MHALALIKSKEFKSVSTVKWRSDDGDQVQKKCRGAEWETNSGLSGD